MTSGDWYWVVVLAFGIVVVYRPTADNFRSWVVLLVTRIIVWALTGV